MSATWPRCELSGKTCYPSPAKARKYARKSHDRGAGHPVLRHYKCPSCGCWHLTKQLQPPTRGPHATDHRSDRA